MEKLFLIIAEPWFSMIQAGEKKEEYREIKPYYQVRFILKNPKICIGNGRPEWGAVPGVNYFVITWEE